jgi:transcriptional antiterminator NusG
MDEQEGDERKDTAPFPVQPETTEPMMVASPDAARESQEMEAASSMEAEAGPKVEEQGEELAASENMSPTDPAGMPEAAVDEPLVMAPSEPVEDESVTPEPAPGPEPVGEGPTLTPVQERRAAAAEGLRRGRLPQGDVPEDGGNEPAWYVIHCYSGYENKVRHNLEQRIETMGMKDRIFDVVIPTQEEIEVKEGKRRTVERHIFPGYVLVNMTLSEESWYVVRNTPGVTGFVGMGNLPTPLRPEEVSQIIKRMESEAPAVKVSFKVAERVRIIDGPFNDFRGTVADIDVERTKVRVMVSFFGRETPVELDFLQVEKA